MYQYEKVSGPHILDYLSALFQLGCMRFYVFVVWVSLKILIKGIHV